MEDLAQHALHHIYWNASNDSALIYNSSRSVSQQTVQLHVPLSLYVFVMVLIDVVGMIGNSLVLIVIIKMRRIQTYTNWMILNLAISDLAVTLFCIPLDIPLLLEEKWIYGKVFCSLYYPLGSAQLFSSVFTLVNITYVRYYAICYPFNEQPSVNHAKAMIVIIRLCSVALVAPIIIVLRYDETSQSCYEEWDSHSDMYYTVIVFLLGFVIPLGVITIGYCRIVHEIVSKKRDEDALVRDEQTIKENRMLVKLSVAVTVTFAICVLPNQLVFILYTFVNLESYKHHLDLLLGSHVMLFLYCALNPIIYNICSDNFRKGVKDLLNGFLNKLASKHDSITSL